MNYQKGFILPPSIMAMAPQLMVYGAIVAATVIAMLSAGLWVQTNRLETAQGFVKAATALGKAQEEASKLKDKQHEDQITSANTARDVALDKLRQRPRTGGVSSIPRTPGETKGICYERAELDGALRVFTEGAQKLIIEGDEAVIDNKAWASSWPK